MRSPDEDELYTIQLSQDQLLYLHHIVQTDITNDSRELHEPMKMFKIALANKLFETVAGL